MTSVLELLTGLRRTGNVAVSNTWTTGLTEKAVLKQMLNGRGTDHKDSRRMSILGKWSSHCKDAEACPSGVEGSTGAANIKWKGGAEKDGEEIQSLEGREQNLRCFSESDRGPWRILSRALWSPDFVEEAH